MTTKTCICGKHHRASTVCATAERILTAKAVAQEIVDVLRAMPAGTVAVLDLREGRASVRTLGGSDDLARLYADGVLTSQTEATDGATLQYLTDCGGFVANGYGYAAHSDYVRVVSAEGRTVVLATRERAQSRSYGRGTVTDRLPAIATVTRAVTHGDRYNVAWCLGVTAALKVAQMARAHREGQAIAPEQLVALDAIRELDMASEF